MVTIGQRLNELRVWDAMHLMHCEGKFHQPCSTSKTPGHRSFQNLNENSMNRDGQIKYQTFILLFNGCKWLWLTLGKY